MAFRKILIPHDFSGHATAALEAGLDLLPPRGGQVVVLHVVAPIAPIADFPIGGGLVPAIEPQEMLAAARRQLETVVQKTLGRRRGVVVRYRVEIGHPTDQILAAARGMDAIVMSTAGRTGLAHLLIGSVAERVVRHATIPVLTVRPRRGRKRARS